MNLWDFTWLAVRIACAIYILIMWRRAQRKIAKLEEDYAHTRKGAAISINELLDDLQASQDDSNRLAEIVHTYVADIDKTAALLKDEKPPEMFAERRALEMHLKLKDSFK